MPLHHMNYIVLCLLASMLNALWDYLLYLLSFIAHIVCVVDFAGKKPLQK